MREQTSRAVASGVDLWGIGFAVIGVLMIGNGIWMLAGTGHWYHHLPAGVPDTGPLNLHFVRDIGCAFLTIGFALCWAWRRPDWRLPLVGIAALFLILHAILHVHDTLRGVVGSDHWLLDAPGVYLPAVILAAGTLRLLRAGGVR